MTKFYICEVCGNLIAMIEDSGAVPVCCNKPMTELTPSVKEIKPENDQHEKYLEFGFHDKMPGH